MTAVPPPVEEKPDVSQDAHHAAGGKVIEKLGESRKPRANDETWQDKLLRSRYLVIAIAIHAIAFLMVGTVVIFEAIVAEEEEGVVFVGGDVMAGAPPPPPPPDALDNPEKLPEVSTQQIDMESPLDVIASDNALADAPPIPIPPAPIPNVDLGAASDDLQPELAKADSFAQRANYIREMRKAWGRGGTGRTPGSGKNVTADFQAYIAKYRNGDWASTIDIKGGKIVNGSIVNLMVYTTQWTNNKIKANLRPKPLDLGSPELFEIKPPFVFMTGHKDFTLTDAEVENLRKYLVQGGCIWGDNGLAGKGSRFDVAFKREMKRVLPDADKQWKELPNNHPIYSQSMYPFRDGPPPGMNYYREPTQAIEMDGQIAVIYTPNNYSDMFRMVYERGTRKPLTNPAANQTRRLPGDLWQNRDEFFRNFEPKSAEEAYKFGINIIVHLLVRFDQQLLLAPQ